MQLDPNKPIWTDDLVDAAAFLANNDGLPAKGRKAPFNVSTIEAIIRGAGIAKPRLSRPDCKLVDEGKALLSAVARLNKVVAASEFADFYERAKHLHSKYDHSVEPLKMHNGGLSTDAADPKKVKALARRLIRPLRREARNHGYALTLHGSRKRDIDLVAVPWSVDASPPEDLARVLRHELKKLYGIKGEVPPNELHPKPHGRLVWCWWIKSWTYVDLSVFPPQSAEAATPEAPALSVSK
ncbi:hypothetical protein HOU02_gp061 [Caulobacter phage CcrBL9]|uniref:Uncharacterized protein n=1 Tax=Caulobacter phage CcrBL9 TaxID=2283270 RepID=A0A385EDK2_9CAUD|nr:hypothetical protein HOU02_gp061 [Caulobacter phage CcrBL9]AXQ69085.1 hypothetical protein CcrBL9_gp061c [Caulobacter phage CcrBL9]